MLEIPHLDKAPRMLRPHRVNPITARAALALLDCGALPGSAPAQTPSELVAIGLRRWLNARAGGMKHIGIHLKYHEGDLGRTPGAGIYFGTHTPYAMRIGERLEALQKDVKGLGETVLWHLDHDLPSPLEIFTPSYALMAAQWTQWGGCDDESERINEIKEVGEDPADYDLLPRKLFDRIIPKWAARPVQRIRPKQLRAIARRRSLAGQVAAELLALHALGCIWEASDDGRRYWPPASVLCWRADDNISLRLLDDIGNDMFESGEYIEQFAVAELPVPQIAHGIPQLLKDAESMVRALRAADRILQLIGTRA